MGFWEVVFTPFLILSNSFEGGALTRIASGGAPIENKFMPIPNSTVSSFLPKITLLNSSNVYPGEIGYMEGSSPLPNLLFQNETVYIVPFSRSTLTFQCEAKYPIFWNLVQSSVHPSVYNALRVLSIRHFEDPFDPSTFTYITTLTMSGPSPKLTGNYSCQSTARNEIQSHIYIYWESQYGNTFLHSKENITLSSKREANGVEVVTLPCQVTDPNTKPRLTKETGLDHQPFQDIQESESVHYSPSVGYTLKNLTNPVGIYKCELDGNDFVSIDIIQRNESSRNDGDAPKEKYTFQYDETMKLVKCCSSGVGRKKPPKIYMILCEHPSTCALREYRGTEWAKYMWNQARRKGSCSVLNLKSYHTGIVRCVGNGFNVYKEFIVPLREEPVHWKQEWNTTTYFRWEEIDPQEMIKVSNTNGVYWDRRENILEPSQDRAIYSREEVHLTCHTSRYYFASGIYWMIRWTNQTITPLYKETDMGKRDFGVIRWYFQYQSRHSNQASFVATSGMEAVICLAPVWNSSLWVSKIYYLYVNETVSPLISDSKLIVKYTWYANETNKELSCSAIGVPPAQFHWEKDNMTILTSAHNYNMVHSNASNKDEATTTSTPATTTNVDPVDEGDTDVSDDELNQNNGNYSETRNETESSKGLTTSSTLRISRVSYSTHGVFRCVATNFGGSVTKEFHVTVIEEKSWKAKGMLVGATLVALLLMIGITFLLRKLHKDRQEINQLTGAGSVNFIDVMRSATATSSNISSAGGAVISSLTRDSRNEEGQQNSAFNPSSTPFDNGRMTNLLIDT